MAENEQVTVEEVSVLIRDAMCGFINARGGLDGEHGAAMYVESRYGSWISGKYKEEKIAQVIKRMRTAYKINRISQLIAEHITSELNEMEFEDA